MKKINNKIKENLETEKSSRMSMLVDIEYQFQNLLIICLHR